MAAGKKQLELFGLPDEKAPSEGACEIVSVGKRRDGGTRYWCLAHKADATAKYGKPAKECRAAHLPSILPQDVFELAQANYSGGVALWGAVPPVYDTTRLTLDFGVHVHARAKKNGNKVIDRTHRAVRLVGSRTPPEGLLISEIDAVYYMVSSVFGFETCDVRCTYCEYPHLDKDWFSIHPHRRHLCAGCGKNFRDSRVGIGNPVREVQQILGLIPRKPTKSKKKLSLRQRDYAGGIQVWGSNPAIIWSSDKPEEEGIHIHAYEYEGQSDCLDDTYSSVEIDGVTLDPLMVRTLMAQNSLPHLKGRIVPLSCEDCGAPEFDQGERAFTPVVGRPCSKCGGRLNGPTRLRRTIGNPLIAVLAELAKDAPRPPQQHAIGLLPETL